MRTYGLYFDNRPQIPYSRLSLISDQYGCVSHRTMRMVEGVPTWLAKEGIVQATGRGVRLASRDVGTLIPDNLSLDENGTQQMAQAVLLHAYAQLLFFYPDQDAVLGGNRALVWHYLERKFTEFTFDTEFTCAELVKAGDGTETIVLGDRWGYVWEYPYGTADGSLCNMTVSGQVDEYIAGVGSPQLCVIVDQDANFPVTGLGLAGVPIYVYGGTGAGQTAIIASNLGDVLYLEECFPVPLDETSLYYLGRIDALYKTGWMDYGTIDRVKKLDYFNLVFERNDSDVQLNIYGDFSDTPTSLLTRDPRAATQEDLGLVDMNGNDEDAENPRGRSRVPLGAIRRTHTAWELQDMKPCNPWSIFDVSVDHDFKEN